MFEKPTTEELRAILAKSERKVRELQTSLIGPRYAGASLSQIGLDKSNQEKVTRFMQSPKNFLIYCGNAGIGKTYFCAALMEWAYSEFFSFRYWNEGELLQRVRASMENFKGDYMQSLQLLIDDPLIILDDIGSTGHTEWREEIFFDTVNLRYDSLQPTVFTSNLSVAEFKKLYHPRICSRLFAKENTIIEILDGEDLRAQGK